jgi:hypothetical protein
VAWLFHLIAGVDRGILASCPRSDRIWATHLGFSLALSFLVVASVTFHASSYVIDSVVVRVCASVVVALTLCAFDRAIFQADWFDQGLLQHGRNWGIGKALKIAARLIISVGLAYTLSVFLELAIFSGSISDIIHQNYTATHGDVADKAAEFDQEIASDIKARQASLTALRAAYTSEKGALSGAADADPERAILQSRADALARDRQRLEDGLVKVRAGISRQQRIMLAEELGEKVEPGSSGHPGRGPKYELAAAQVAASQEEELRLADALKALTASESETAQSLQALGLRQAEALKAAQALHSDGQKTLAAQIDKAQSELTAIQLSRNDRVLEYQRRLLNGQDFSSLRDDPITRLSAYRQLKASPENGEAVQQFSLMLKSLIIFLEVAPVLAKLFFSPPSIYAARLREAFEEEILAIQHRTTRLGSAQEAVQLDRHQPGMAEIDRVKGPDIAGAEIADDATRQPLGPGVGWAETVGADVDTQANAEIPTTNVPIASAPFRTPDSEPALQDATDESLHATNIPANDPGTPVDPALADVGGPQPSPAIACAASGPEDQEPAPSQVRRLTVVAARPEPMVPAAMSLAASNQHTEAEASPFSRETFTGSVIPFLGEPAIPEQASTSKSEGHKGPDARDLHEEEISTASGRDNPMVIQDADTLLFPRR